MDKKQREEILLRAAKVAFEASGGDETAAFQLFMEVARADPELYKVLEESALEKAAQGIIMEVIASDPDEEVRLRDLRNMTKEEREEFSQALDFVYNAKEQFKK